MRTTLTLDPDVAAMLKKEMRQQKATLKETINKALRAGLGASDAPKTAVAPYRVKTLDLGGPFLIDITCTGEALAAAEGEDHK